MEDKMVVVGQFDTPENAHLAKIDLEGAGIEAVIENDVLPSIGLFYTMPTCSVKLLVRERDAEQARRVLQDIESGEPAVDENGNPLFKDEDCDEIEPE
jgi:hypothetical protein